MVMHTSITSTPHITLTTREREQLGTVLLPISRERNTGERPRSLRWGNGNAGSRSCSLLALLI